MKLQILTGIILSMTLQAQAFMSGEKVLDISRGVFAKIIEEDSKGFFSIQHTTGPLSQMVLEGISSNQLGALNGRVKNISVGEIVFDTYRKTDVLVVALGGDNKFVVRPLTGPNAGKFLPGYAVEYLKADDDSSSALKLENKVTVVVEKVPVQVPKVKVNKVKPSKPVVAEPALMPQVVTPVKTSEETIPVLKKDFTKKAAANMLLKRGLED